ncbi:hypothetical protein ABNQ24_12270 [Ralstonia pseudosolanacearum]|uniref:hypothetical protein n=1 Tax=Ralstonia pseudosolanacearum TaxID=1310165 RepID=UPI00336A879C
MGFFFRVHEWLADRVTFIQYPRIRRIRAAQVCSTYTPMKPSAPTAVMLCLAGVVGLFAAAALIAAGLFVVYLVVSNLF